MHTLCKNIQIFSRRAYGIASRSGQQDLQFWRACLSRPWYKPLGKNDFTNGWMARSILQLMYIGIFCRNLKLFCRDIGLVCKDMGLFCPYLNGTINLLLMYIWFCCQDIRLFCRYIWLFCLLVERFDPRDSFWVAAINGPMYIDMGSLSKETKQFRESTYCCHSIVEKVRARESMRAPKQTQEGIHKHT